MECRRDDRLLLLSLLLCRLFSFSFPFFGAAPTVMATSVSCCDDGDGGDSGGGEDGGGGDGGGWKKAREEGQNKMNEGRKEGREDGRRRDRGGRTEGCRNEDKVK